MRKKTSDATKKKRQKRKKRTRGTISVCDSRKLHDCPRTITINDNRRSNHTLTFSTNHDTVTIRKRKKKNSIYSRGLKRKKEKKRKKKSMLRGRKESFEFPARFRTGLRA